MFTPTVPGGYAVRTRGGPVLAWVATNASAAESDVRRTTSLAGTAVQAAPERYERSVELTPWLWGLALAGLTGAAGMAAMAAWRRGRDVAA